MFFVQPKRFFSKIRYYIGSFRKARQRKVLLLSIVNTMMRFPRSLFFFSLRLSKHLFTFLPDRLKLFLRQRLSPLNKKKIGVRRYLHPELSLEELFIELKLKDINYIILRWFESFPIVKEGEDIDLLVDDKDLLKLADLFVYYPAGQAFDIYSVSGMSGANYKNVPYYPPHLAKKILESRVWFKKIYAVPDPEHHFLSLAYHAIFHKGQNSGLNHEKHPHIVTPDHDYARILQLLAQEAMIECESYSFNDLYNYLKTNNWAPEHDTLRILSASDPWLRALLPELSPKYEGELMAFVVREWALENNKLDVILKLLRDAKLDILTVHKLSQMEKENAKLRLRGGKWDQGPYPVSGGHPVCFIVCYDYHPEPPSPRESNQYPFVKNRHVFLKHKIRDYINAELLLFRQTNCIHSADDEFEAWEYLRCIAPTHLDNIKAQVELRQQRYATNYPVLKLYETNRTRAKVELIDYYGQRAVKKTFKIGCERFCEREAFAYSYFSQKLPTVPRLLERDSNYVIIPWYENILEQLPQLEKEQVIRTHGKTIIDSMRLFFEEGYALIGFYAGNLIITPTGEVRLVDFEFLYKYKTMPESFLTSYDIKGIPRFFDGDLPAGLQGKGHTYNNTWRPILGPLKQYL